MYNALVWPHFNYCSTIWNDGSCSKIDKLFKLQKRVACVITGDTYDVRSTQILNNLNWLPIEELLKKREVIMTFKALTGRLPQYLVKLFTRCQNNNYNLRSIQTKLALPKPKTNFPKRSSHIELWNHGMNFRVKPSKITMNYQSYRLNDDYIIRYKIDADTTDTL